MSSTLTGSDYIYAPRFQRQVTESSTTAPEHDQNAPDLILPPGHEIGVYRDGVNGNLRLLSPGNKTPLYFIRSSLLRPNTADVTMFAGNNRNGKVIGVCSYAAFSTSINVGRGDPAHPNSMEWEEVTKTSRDHSSYNFSVWSRGAERRSYSWKRTQDSNIKGTKSSKFDRRSWKLEDDTSGEVVAVFAAQGINSSLKKVGKFRILATEEKEWEEWVLLTSIGLYEKARRRAIARRDLSWFF